MISIKQTNRFDKFGNQVFELILKKNENHPWIHEVSPQELEMLKKMLDELEDVGVI